MADPINKGSCALWLDADDASTIHGTPVDTWDDKSGNGRTATGLTTARPSSGTRTFPTSLKNVLDFDGTTDRMTTASFSLAQTFTIAAVVLNDSGADSTQQVIICDITNSRALQKATTNFWRMNDGTALDSSVGADTSGHYLIAVCKASPNGVIRVGATETTGNLGSGSWGGGVSIGSTAAPAGFWNGMIAEIVVYSAELNSTDRAALATYFTDKWFTAPPAATNAPAGNGLVAVSSKAVTAKVSPSGGNVPVGAAAGVASVKLAVPAEVANVGVAANFDGTDNNVSLSLEADAPLTIGVAAGDPTVIISSNPLPAQAAVGVAAGDPTLTISSDVLDPYPGLVGVEALDAEVLVDTGIDAENAGVGVTAGSPSIKVATPAEGATVGAAAVGATAQIAPHAGGATVGVQAKDGAPTTASIANANGGRADVGVEAGTPSISISVSVGVGVVGASAKGAIPTTATAALAGVALVGVAAGDPATSYSISVFAERALVGVAAHGPSTTRESRREIIVLGDLDPEPTDFAEAVSRMYGDGR